MFTFDHIHITKNELEAQGAENYIIDFFDDYVDGQFFKYSEVCEHEHLEYAVRVCRSVFDDTLFWLEYEVAFRYSVKDTKEPKRFHAFASYERNYENKRNAVMRLFHDAMKDANILNDNNREDFLARARFAWRKLSDECAD